MLEREAVTHRSQVGQVVQVNASRARGGVYKCPAATCQFPCSPTWSLNSQADRHTPCKRSLQMPSRHVPVPMLAHLVVELAGRQAVERGLAAGVGHAVKYLGSALADHALQRELGWSRWEHAIRLLGAARCRPCRPSYVGGTEAKQMPASTCLPLIVQSNLSEQLSACRPTYNSSTPTYNSSTQPTCSSGRPAFFCLKLMATAGTSLT